MFLIHNSYLGSVNGIYFILTSLQHSSLFTVSFHGYLVTVGSSHRDDDVLVFGYDVRRTNATLMIVIICYELVILLFFPFQYIVETAVFNGDGDDT